LGLKGYKSPFVFIWDEDAANCIRQAVYSEKTGIYNLIGDGALCNKDLALLLGKSYRELNAGLMRRVLSLLRPLGLSKYGPEQLLFLQYRPVMDNRKLKEEFGFLPEKSSLETFCFYLETHNIKPQHLDRVKVLESTEA
jgi:UDP-glucose 4-epimerase